MIARLNPLLTGAMVIASSCSGPSVSPTILNCYQSGLLRLNFDNGKVMSNNGIQDEFKVNHRKVGWVISSKLVIGPDSKNNYSFSRSNSGLQDWRFTDPSGLSFMVVSQDGVPFYFGKCLDGRKENNKSL